MIATTMREFLVAAPILRLLPLTGIFLCHRVIVASSATVAADRIDGATSSRAATDHSIDRDTMSSSSSASCVDDPTFTSMLGLPCSQHKRLLCDGFRSLGFDDADVDELLWRCPASCRVSHCYNEKGDVASVRLEQRRERKRTISTRHEQRREIKRTINPTKDLERVGGVSLVDAPSDIFEGTSSNRRRAAEEGEKACYPGWDKMCRDDPLFISPLSLPCSGHMTFDCRMTDFIGFTEEETKSLIISCPCSCRIECGTVTWEPTSSPTHGPTISHQPSVSPSTWPSVSPTVAPSRSPTLNPTHLPSQSPSEVPTPVPSSSPSVSPSAVPSESPSTLPSTAPTQYPSHVPTRAPTDGPTRQHSNSPSGEPSVSPTFSWSSSPSALPSELPSELPSQLPSRSPSDQPTNVPSFVPSTAPSVAPTATRSSSPSALPSSEPSDAPTPMHSAAPSTSIPPSFSPSSSHQPSASPSISAMPSISSEPSIAQTYTPSISPSSSPTENTVEDSIAEKDWSALAKSAIGREDADNTESDQPFLSTFSIILIASVAGGMVLLTASYCIISRALRRRRQDNDNEGPRILFMRSKSFANKFTNDNDEAGEADDYNGAASPVSAKRKPSRRYGPPERSSSRSESRVVQQRNGLACNGGVDSWLQGVFCAGPSGAARHGDNSISHRVAM